MVAVRSFAVARLLLGALVLLSALTTVTAQMHGVILLQISGYVHMQANEVGLTGVETNIQQSQQWCNDRGASLIAVNGDLLAYNIVENCAKNYNGGLCTTIVDGSAKPPEDDRQFKCIEDESTVVNGPSSMWCTYRWRFGFYDMFSETANNENSRIVEEGYTNPGLCYFKCLFVNPAWADNPLQHFCNSYFIYAVWNGSTPAGALQKGYPHGKFQTVGGVQGNSLLRMDVPQVITHNDPNPLSSYLTSCYLQDYPLPAALTTKMPQPPVVEGYKTLTWPQENWWVLFLIIAAILLIILVSIIVYCTVTAAKPKEEPPVAMMVQRERKGHLYGELDEEDSKSREAPSVEAPAPRKKARAPATDQQPLLPPVYPPMQTLPPVDPEDLAQGIPRVFSQDDTMLTGENDSFMASDDDGEDESSR